MATREQKREMVNAAWGEYRAASQRIPNATPWDVFLDADERLWKRYLATEREIAALPETRAA